VGTAAQLSIAHFVFGGLTKVQTGAVQTAASIHDALYARIRESDKVLTAPSLRIDRLFERYALKGVTIDLILTSFAFGSFFGST
jgi:hypothetical protein